MGHPGSLVVATQYHVTVTSPGLIPAVDICCVIPLSPHFLSVSTLSLQVYELLTLLSGFLS